MNIIEQISQNINNAISAFTKPAIRTMPPLQPQGVVRQPPVIPHAVQKMGLDISDYSNSEMAHTKRILLEQQGKQTAANLMNQRKQKAEEFKRTSETKAMALDNFYRKEQQDFNSISHIRIN